VFFEEHQDGSEDLVVLFNQIQMDNISTGKLNGIDKISQDSNIFFI